MLPLSLLAGTAVVLLAVTVRGARPCSLDGGGLLDRWSELHAGYDPRGNRWVHGWLRLVEVAAGPLARRGVQPDAITLWTAWLAVAAVVAALPGGRWPLLAGLLVVAAALADGLDGAVAALTGRATAWGAVLDSALDRVGDALFVVAVWVLGAPGWLAVTAGGLGGLHEYVRARASASGMQGIGAVTVAERPTRVICCAAGLLGAGAVPAYARQAATVALAALAALSLAGLVHLTVRVRRSLRG